MHKVGTLEAQPSLLALSPHSEFQREIIPEMAYKRKCATQPTPRHVPFNTEESREGAGTEPSSLARGCCRAAPHAGLLRGVHSRGHCGLRVFALPIRRASSPRSSSPCVCGGRQAAGSVAAKWRRAATSSCARSPPCAWSAAPAHRSTRLLCADNNPLERRREKRDQRCINPPGVGRPDGTISFWEA